MRDAPRLTRSGEPYLARGHRIAGKYVIEATIGEGATSVVYLARVEGAPSGPRRSAPAPLLGDDSQPTSLRLVALKVIHRHLCEDAQIMGRFRREAEILKRLDAPHVVRVHEAIEDEGSLALALEYIAGAPLDRHIEERRPLGVSEAIEITLQVCAGLGSAHAAGVVHRDLKPANVIRSAAEPGGRVMVKVTDFGLAKVVHGHSQVTGLTEHDMIFGTPEYMAPEQARGDDVDGRADLYAAGCILYEMLTGEAPFRRSTPVLTMSAHLSDEVTPPRRRRPGAPISPALEAVVMRALAKSPADRYPTARAFAEALRAAEDAPLVIAAPASSAADALSDTDLSISGSFSSTPGPVEVGGDAPADVGRDAPAEISASVSVQAQSAPLPRAGRAPDAASPLPPQSGASSWLWVAVAVFVVLAGIAAGVALGLGAL